MRYERVTVKRDTQTTYARDVVQWEIPLLEFIFEQGNVVRTGVFTSNDVPYPDAAIEFDRLARAYGVDPANDIPRVVSVYGDSGRGVRELRNAIKEAQAEADAAKPRRTRRKVKLVHASDPLLA